MELQQLENLVNEASYGSGQTKIRATQMIDSLRLEPDRWRHGLKLFFDGSTSISKVFGLSLVRDFVKSYPDSAHRASRLAVREAIFGWACEALQTTTIEPYIMNNVANILTLCIKNDFPENWPTAFDEILSFSEMGRSGTNLSTRIIADLDVEVVMFSEGRTQEEVAHNTCIKDAMREGCIIENIVQFLCGSVIVDSPQRDDLSCLCLTSLAEMIGWIDINLIVNDTVLPRLYQFLLDKTLCSPACDCLLEIAKKGMDSVDKVKLISSIRLVDTLSCLPFDSSENVEHGEESIGSVADMIFQELLSCWISFESYAVEAGEAINEQKHLLEIGQLTGELLQQSLPLVLKVFTHQDSAVAGTVIASLKKLIQHMKKQQSYGDTPRQREAALEPKLSQAIVSLRSMYADWFFVAIDFLSPVLEGVYTQLQYPADFYEMSAEADEDDVDIADEIETKNQVRQLFVQCVRIRPLSCLELIAAVLTSLPQPLCSAPFPQLEAALRLVHSIGECGPQYNSMLQEGMFPGIMEALHQSDIHLHENPLVLMAYYDVAARYAAMSPMSTVQNVMSAMISNRGIRHPDNQLRSRSAYLLRKIVETLKDEAGCLVGAVGAFSDLLVTQSGQESLLPEQAEMHLLEAIGLITSAGANGDTSGSGSSSTEGVDPHMQLSLLEEILSTLVHQLLSLLEDEEAVVRYGQQMAEFAAWKFSSIAALIRGHTPKTHGGNSADLFLKATVSIVPVLAEFGKFKLSRSKGIVLFHRIVASVGSRVIEPAGACLATYIQWADASDIEFPLQLINQLMAEYGNSDRLEDMLIIVDEMLPLILDKLGSLYEELQAAEVAAKARVEGGGGEDDDEEIVDTSLEADKVSIQKHYLLFLQHIACNACHPALLSERNMQRLPDILTNIVSGLRGGEDDGITAIVGLALRRPAVTCLAYLTRAWIREDSSVHPEVENLLLSFICEQGLPISLGACSDGSLNVMDPQTQSFVGDVAVLVWTVAAVRREDTLKYLQDGLLPSLGWPSAAIADMMGLVQDIGTETSFRDRFKKLMRKLNSK